MLGTSKTSRRSQVGIAKKVESNSQNRYMILRMDLYVTISELETAEVVGEWEIVERNVALAAAIQHLSQFDWAVHQAVLMIWPQDLPFPV